MWTTCRGAVVVALLAWLTASTRTVLAADCSTRTIGETSQSVLDAAAQRFKAFGVNDISFVHPLTGRFTGRMYRLSGTPVSMALATEDGLAKEISFALSSPSTPANRDAQASMAAYFVARLSGEEERDVRSQILDAENQETAGVDKVFKHRNQVVLVVSKIDAEDLVLTVGELVCR